MGKIKTENMDDKELFLGNSPQKGFYEALHFMHSQGGINRMNKEIRKVVKESDIQEATIRFNKEIGEKETKQ